MTTYTIDKSPPGAHQFAIGKTSGALYVKTVTGRWVCIIARGMYNIGEDYAGNAESNLDILPPGTKITITV